MARLISAGASGDRSHRAHAPWFERMLAEVGHELWIGDAAQIRLLVVRQAEDGRARRDALTGVAAERTFSAHLAADDGG